MDIPVTYLGTSKDPANVGKGNTRMVVRMAPEGLYLLHKKDWGAYAWGDVKRVSFDDPGRTKASVGMIVAFGVLGLAKRKTFTLLTVSTAHEETYYEIAEPIGLWRAKARGIVDEVSAMKGRVFVDGVPVGEDGTLASAPVAFAPTQAGWYPDPLGRQQLRWHDGSNWTDNVNALPEAPQ
jgi:hypothetical protein